MVSRCYIFVPLITLSKEMIPLPPNIDSLPPLKRRWNLPVVVEVRLRLSFVNGPIEGSPETTIEMLIALDSSRRMAEPRAELINWVGWGGWQYWDMRHWATVNFFIHNKMVNSSNWMDGMELLAWLADKILFNITTNWWNWPLNDGQMDLVLSYQIWSPDCSIISHA